MLWLLSTLFSASGLSGAVVLIIGGVIAAMWLRVPKVFILSGVAVGVAYLAIGGFARAVDDACMKRTAREVLRLEAEWQVRLDLVRKQNQVFLNEIEAQVDQAQAESAQLEAERAEIPVEQKCFLETQEDVDAFNHRRR